MITDLGQLHAHTVDEIDQPLAQDALRGSSRRWRQRLPSSFPPATFRFDSRSQSSKSAWLYSLLLPPKGGKKGVHIECRRTHWSVRSWGGPEVETVDQRLGTKCEYCVVICRRPSFSFAFLPPELQATTRTSMILAGSKSMLHSILLFSAPVSHVPENEAVSRIGKAGTGIAS